jgi:hypothetical protein
MREYVRTQRSHAEATEIMPALSSIHNGLGESVYLLLGVIVGND